MEVLTFPRRKLGPRADRRLRKCGTHKSLWKATCTSQLASRTTELSHCMECKEASKNEFKMSLKHSETVWKKTPNLVVQGLPLGCAPC
jgi:hypothetical protein